MITTVVLSMDHFDHNNKHSQTHALTVHHYDYCNLYSTTTRDAARPLWWGESTTWRYHSDGTVFDRLRPRWSVDTVSTTLWLLHRWGYVLRRGDWGHYVTLRDSVIGCVMYHWGLGILKTPKSLTYKSITSPSIYYSNETSGPPHTEKFPRV